MKALVIGLVGLLFALPLLYVVEVSLHPEGRGLVDGPGALLGEAHFENYARALGRMGDFPRLLANTLLITLLSIGGQLLCCSLAGYAFARLEFRGREALFLLVLATMLLPEQVSAIPRFLLFRWLGMVDSFYPLVLPTVLGGAPFFVFLFRQVFRSMPAELTEAARLDGCSHWGIYWRVCLPLARPMLAAVGVMTFLATWNDFWSPLIYLLSPEKRTLTLALAGFNQTYNTAVEHMMAATAVVIAPCLLVYFLAQRLFLGGISTAASKH
jgi:multiple sugar transport system permease protein